MSGAGRKHRAKHLTRQYLDVNAWEGPGENETLAVCTEPPHGQHVRVLLLTTVAGADLSDKKNQDKEGQFFQEVLVHVPRKFHKVIWLGIKDVLVVADGCVQFKPSPEQLENFLRNSANAEWNERIIRARNMAIENRRAVERMPLYNKQATTTLSELPCTDNVDNSKAPVENGFGAGHTRKIKGESSNHTEECNRDSDNDSLSRVVNPNRGTIKHRQQFFYACEADEEMEEEEEES
ncbi:unnamed protein product [Phytomonas sp. EM1]|nr:unnamed protein product [Phytomonas sp. EM1]|eukprot:CCW60965.1 unnamed protein product [Phytomonas sp. isolate EM1]